MTGSAPAHDALADALVAHLDARAVPPEIVALGEPLHGEPAFLRWWSRALDRLVEAGVRSVALETDAVAALALDAWVRGGPGSLDDVLTTGFTHGFGQRGGMRELLAGLRVRNDERPPADRVAVHGFDLPAEASGAPSPRPHLEHLHAFLATVLGAASVPVDAADLDALLGPDEPWGAWEAQLGAARSVGATPAAVALRAVADDLVVLLHAEAPRLVAATSHEAWRAAELQGRTALGLLRYHAAAARAVPRDQRLLRLLTARDEGMARHLLAIRARERRRGATVVLAHDRHLQRERSTWTLEDQDAAWTSAGAVVAAVSGEDYVHVAAVLGSSPTLGVGPPSPGTLEAAVAERGGWVGDPPGLAGIPARADVAAEHGYLPLDEALPGADAVVLVDAAAPPPADDPSVTDLAARLLARPGVTHLRADEASGAPAVAHGDWFFHARPDDRMPFATLVTGDYPGHDETSRLDRPGVFRLNLGVGRAALEEVVDPDAAPDARDRLVAHPVYGAQGWVAVLCPSAARLPEIERLVDAALARARRSG